MILDIQQGRALTENGYSVALSPDDMSILYLCALRAPDDRIASAIRAAAAHVRDAKGDLAGRLGVPVSELERLPVQINTGHWPKSDLPWADRHAGTLVSQGLDRPDDQILAYVAGQGALSVGEVKALVNRVRAGLRANNVGEGDLVALDSTQRIESFLLAIAILLEGAAIVCIGDNIGPDTMVSMLRAAPSVMTFSAHLDVLGAENAAGVCVSLDPGTTGGFPTFSDWLAGCPEEPEHDSTGVRLTPTDVAFVGFTSGSTGTPKVVLNTHEAIWRSTEVAARLLGFTSEDIFFTATDFVALSGFRSMLSLPFYSGGRVVFPTEGARKDPFTQALEAQKYGVTCLTAVPNVLRGFLAAGDRLGGRELSSLRLVMSGCGVLDAPTAQAFHERFGLAVVDYYGQREAATSLYSVPGEATTLSTGGGRAAEALIRILDDTGRPVAVGDVGDVGEILVQTDCKRVETSEPVARNREHLQNAHEQTDPHLGWHRTGDLARVGADGNIVITGRKSDIIKTPDGQLLFPIEVENNLNADPQVLEACVFPFRLKDGVERVGAAVLCAWELLPEQRDAVEDRLRWSVRDKLGAYKTPHRVLVLHRFPRGGREKPDRKALLGAFLQEFGD